jgi:membrane protein DedA with SNARE-associated domain
VSTFFFIGYHFGPRWQEILGMIERNLKEASLVAGVILVIYLAYWYARRKAKRSPNQ